MSAHALEQACFSGRTACRHGLPGSGFQRLGRYSDNDQRSSLRSLVNRRSWRCAAGEPGAGDSHFASTVSGSSGRTLLKPVASAGSSGGGALANQGPDYFQLAGLRLQSLLSGVGDGEDELMNGMIMEQTPEQKLYLSALAGSILGVAAYFACWLFGLDFFGGASLSVKSLEAALVGALCSLPLVAAKAYLWSDVGKQQISWVEDWHENQVEVFKPLLDSLTPAQTAVFMCTEVVPGVLLMLPAAMGGLTKAAMFASELAGVDTPLFVAQSAALVLTAGAAGLAKLGENAMTYEEYNIIKTALDNADRYYKLMVSGRDSGPADATRAADAFKVVAITWMARSQLVSQLAAAVAVFEVACLGVIWQETGDLAAPLTAALAAAAVDFWYISRRISKPSSSSRTS